MASCFASMAMLLSLCCGTAQEMYWHERKYCVLWMMDGTFYYKESLILYLLSIFYNKSSHFEIKFSLPHVLKYCFFLRLKFKKIFPTWVIYLLKNIQCTYKNQLFLCQVFKKSKILINYISLLVLFNDHTWECRTLSLVY